LDAADPETEPFFKALILHARALSRKACHRTALEILRLCLALDYKDLFTSVVCLTVDYLCIRSNEHDYLLKFYREFPLLQAEREKAQFEAKEDRERRVSVAFWPSFAFNVALAFWEKEKSATATDKSASKQFSSSSFCTLLSEAKSLADSLSLPLSADFLLQRAILAFPEALLTLLSKTKTKDKEEEEEKKWNPVLNHAFFDRASQRARQCDYLNKLVFCFAERSVSLWKRAEVSVLVCVNRDRIML